MGLSLSVNLKNHSAGLAGHLGKLVSSDLFKDGQKNIAEQHQNIELLKNIKSDWIQERNVVVQLFQLLIFTITGALVRKIIMQ